MVLLTFKLFIHNFGIKNMLGLALIFLGLPLSDGIIYLGMFAGCLVIISSTIRSIAEVWAIIQEQKRINRDFELNLKIKKKENEKH